MYQVVMLTPAVAALKDLPRKIASQISAKVIKLAEDPRPQGASKLQSRAEYRIRQGNYRVLYEIDDSAKTIIVTKIAHRREAYRS